MPCATRILRSARRRGPDASGGAEGISTRACGSAITGRSMGLATSPRKMSRPRQYLAKSGPGSSPNRDCGGWYVRASAPTV
jgi:hypothetical protein